MTTDERLAAIRARHPKAPDDWVDEIGWLLAQLEQERQRSSIHLSDNRHLLRCNEKLVARVAEMEEALRVISEPDELLDANEGAFNVHAARRMQAQARAALGLAGHDT